MKKEIYGEICCDLKIRYLFMIVIGGLIGMGLFLVSGNVIYIVGFGGVLVVYIVIGIMVYFLMISLGEMVIYMFVFGLFSIYVS